VTTRTRRPAWRVLYDVFCWAVVVVLGWLALAGGARLLGVPWWWPAAIAGGLAGLADLTGDWAARRNPRRLGGAELAAGVAVPGLLVTVADAQGTGLPFRTLTVAWVTWWAWAWLWVRVLNPPGRRQARRRGAVPGEWRGELGRAVAEHVTDLVRALTEDGPLRVLFDDGRGGGVGVTVEALPGRDDDGQGDDDAGWGAGAGPVWSPGAGTGTAGPALRIGTRPRTGAPRLLADAPPAAAPVPAPRVPGDAAAPGADRYAAAVRAAETADATGIDPRTLAVIMGLARRPDGVRAGEVAQAIGKHRSTASKHLAALARAGHLVPFGAGRGAGYRAVP
jgi:hypothetical protein